MKHAGSVLSIAGLALAVMLFAREDPSAIISLVVAAGPGLIAAGLFHALPMVLNARAWQRLFERPERPTLRALTLATWIRESVNALLPVARVGGEIVAFRMARRSGVSGTDAVATLVADMALSVLTQAAFTVVGLGLMLVVAPAAAVTTQLLAGAAFAAVLGLAFVLLQRSGVAHAIARLADHLAAGRLRGIITESVRLDDALRDLYRRRRDVSACIAWQLAAWVLGAGEIWLALHFLGHPRGVLDAIVIEALIQAISSAAFMIPAALGVQEGGFLLIGALLGIDGATALALATARRLRDVIVFFPGLLAWQRAEARARSMPVVPAAAGTPCRSSQDAGSPPKPVPSDVEGRE